MQRGGPLRSEEAVAQIGGVGGNGPLFTDRRPSRKRGGPLYRSRDHLGREEPPVQIRDLIGGEEAPIQIRSPQGRQNVPCTDRSEAF